MNGNYGQGGGGQRQQSAAGGLVNMLQQQGRGAQQFVVQQQQQAGIGGQQRNAATGITPGDRVQVRTALWVFFGFSDGDLLEDGTLTFETLSDHFSEPRTSPCPH